MNNTFFGVLIHLATRFYGEQFSKDGTVQGARLLRFQIAESFSKTLPSVCWIGFVARQSCPLWDHIFTLWAAVTIWELSEWFHKAHLQVS